MNADLERGALISLLWLVGSAVAAVVIGYAMATYGWMAVPLLAVMVGAGIFFVASPRWWWVPLPASYAIGGMLYFGFKIYTHELALVVCVLPLLFAAALNRRAVQQERAALPGAHFWLFLYLVSHLSWSIWMARRMGEGGYGNILRHYTWALWPLCFGSLYYRFGSTKYLRPALLMLLGAYFLRVALTVVTHHFPAFLYVPLINFVLPGSTIGQADDLRSGALGLGIVALALGAISTRLVWRVGAVALGGLALYGVLLGAGRVSLAMFLCLPLALAWAARRYDLLGAAGGAGLALLLTLNVNPQLLDGVDIRVQRTLSILVLEHGAARSHAITESSNLWHQRLRELAIERWLGSSVSFLVGNRIRRFDAEVGYIHGQQEMAFERALEKATEVGAYETGWFSTLAITGAVGLGLYLWLGIRYMRRPWAYLRAHGVAGPEGAFCFLGVFTTVMWFAFGWTYGGYPSFELVLLMVADAACGDAARAPGPARFVAPLAPVGSRRMAAA